jgi:dethiobiotin synthetase
MQRTLFITGTDTGVGKTMLTVLLTQFLRERGVNVGTLKPICSGSREDVRKILAAMKGAFEVQSPKSKVQSLTLSLDEINPWHFRAPVAPLPAARKENKRVKFSQVLTHVRAMQKRFDVLLIEGAGGLLSPLGENFNSRDLIVSLRATSIIVCPNRLGVVNQVLLTLEALPKNLQAKARVVLMSPQRPDASAKTNARLLAEFFDAKRIFSLPHFDGKVVAVRVLKIPRVQRMLRALTENVM